MAVVNGAALLVLTLKEEQLDLKRRSDKLPLITLTIHLVGEVVNLGDQPRPAFHLPASTLINTC